MSDYADYADHADKAERAERDPYAETRAVANPANPADLAVPADASMGETAPPVVPDAESMPRYEAAPQSAVGASPEPAFFASQDADMLGSFDAFRARRAQERAQQEPFPHQYGGESPETYAGLSASAGSDAFPAPGATPPEYTQVAPPPPFATVPVPVAPRRRLRSAVVAGGILALVVGVGAGVWAATGSSTGSSVGSSSGSTGQAAAGTSSAGAAAPAGSKAAKAGRAVTARLTVTSVGSDSFTATNARGETLVVRLTSTTRFGTVKRPFARAQLVPGAVVTARLRDESDGTVVATVIAAAAAAPDGLPSASGPADGTA